MLYDATGFALALGPTDDEIVARPWMHFAVGLDDRHAVRKLRHRLAADGVELVEEWDEPDMSASSAAIRTATRSLLGTTAMSSAANRATMHHALAR
jgi:hypothetical protein